MLRVLNRGRACLKGAALLNLPRGWRGVSRLGLQHVQTTPCGLQLGLDTLATRANGHVVACLGESVVLVAALSGPGRSDADFLQLKVDHRTPFWSRQIIPGNFFRNEGNAGEDETLCARAIDRSIRPVFPAALSSEVQIVSQMLSAEQREDPFCTTLAINAASAALLCSDIPFTIPVGAVRVAEVDGSFLLHPNAAQLDAATFDVLYVGTPGHVIMLEASGSQVPEARLVAALEVADKAVGEVVKAQEELVSCCGRPKPVFESPVSEDLLAVVREQLGGECSDEAKKRLLADLPSGEHTEAAVKLAVQTVERELERNQILQNGVREDGRGCDELRPLEARMNVLPKVHGSAVFARGDTRALGVATVGPRELAMRQNEGRTLYQPLLLQYDFPPFCVDEVRRWGRGRRDIGHGALAQKALLPALIPCVNRNQSLRVNSTVMASNGSSSMATVCSTSLALRDVGVECELTAGISIGLVTDSTSPEQFRLLTDITGHEDSIGDMDFKLAGTRLGWTALQMDVKAQRGVSLATIIKATERAKAARGSILDVMKEAVKEPQKQTKRNIPKVQRMSTLRLSRAVILKHISSLESLVGRVKVGLEEFSFFGSEDDAAAAEEWVNGLLSKNTSRWMDKTKEDKPGSVGRDWRIRKGGHEGRQSGGGGDRGRKTEGVDEEPEMDKRRKKPSFLFSSPGHVKMDGTKKNEQRRPDPKAAGVQGITVGSVYSATVKNVMGFGAIVQSEQWNGTCVLHVNFMVPGALSEDKRPLLEEGDKVKVKCIEVDSRGVPMLVQTDEQT